MKICGTLGGAVCRWAWVVLLAGASVVAAEQVVSLDGTAGGQRFEGIGAVSGGGATSVLLKDYPEPQRSQVLDLLFRPKFGASMSALLVEVPGDGNSTQGSEPSHMHARGDLNFGRGYEWWLMREAKRRNPALTLDACAWGCPGWVGDGHFWSQDMCDYYATWVAGLKSVYGVDLDALGCRNEKGVNEDFAKRLRATLDARGLGKVRVHGFDNWDSNKFNWTADLTNDAGLRGAVAILSNHTLSDIPASAGVQALAGRLGKPIWDTEEHVYKKGFDCEISLVQSFNDNYIRSGATRIVNWYLVGAVYPVEPYAEEPPPLIANSPWSGHYEVREALWGYAHYGQFCQAGWQYLNGGCGELAGGGSLVTLKSPGTDYSIILETKDATAAQRVTFQLGGGLRTGRLCVWRSDAQVQFIRLADIRPRDGAFTVELAPHSIYSLSTTSGQRKGAFEDVPPARDFPFPYAEDFREYKSAAQWGWLPHYTADIAGVFEIAERADHPGKCLRQVLDHPAQSWAPEWLPYTILGDRHWRDYEVSADILLDGGGWAGVMGRVNDVGSGWGSVPKGYYLRWDGQGGCSLYVSEQAKDEEAGTLLASGAVSVLGTNRWHNLKLQFAGGHIMGFVDGARVVSVTNDFYTEGMAGLLTGDFRVRNTACFANLRINGVGSPPSRLTSFPGREKPLYRSDASTR